MSEPRSPDRSYSANLSYLLGPVVLTSEDIGCVRSLLHVSGNRVEPRTSCQGLLVSLKARKLFPVVFCIFSGVIQDNVANFSYTTSTLAWCGVQVSMEGDLLWNRIWPNLRDPPPPPPRVLSGRSLYPGHSWTLCCLGLWRTTHIDLDTACPGKGWRLDTWYTDMSGMLETLSTFWVENDHRWNEMGRHLKILTQSEGCGAMQRVRHGLRYPAHHLVPLQFNSHTWYLLAQATLSLNECLSISDENWNDQAPVSPDFGCLAISLH